MVAAGKRVTVAPTSDSSYWLFHDDQQYSLPWVEEEAPPKTLVDRAYWELLEEEVQSPYRLRVEEQIQYLLAAEEARSQHQRS
jgi:hypothetical protein